VRDSFSQRCDEQLIEILSPPAEVAISASRDFKIRE